MRLVKPFFWSKWTKSSPPQVPTPQHTEKSLPANSEITSNDPSLWPTFPHPPPRELLRNRDAYLKQSLKRRYGAPRGVLEDTSLYALHRLYEHLLLDDNIGLRNELESFWWKHWPVSSIPDPGPDTERERYVVMSCIPALLVEAFNARIDMGLRREGMPIMSAEEREKLAATEKKYEAVPEWTKEVPPLDEMLHIEHRIEGESQLTGLDDARASKAFKEKNILIWMPHVHFV